MSGLVGVIGNDSARYSLFWACMDDLQMPPGWTKRKLIGGDWCGARNALVEETLAGDYSHLWFMDDDHAFAPNILLRLLEHDLPLVLPACLTRAAPFPMVTFTERLEDDEKGNAQYVPLYLPEHEPQGLVKIEAGGTAGMLISREILEAMEPPWFEYGFASEDILFCQKARELGFDIYCDLSIRLGHIAVAVVEPAFYDGQWATGVSIGSTGQMQHLLLPIGEREKEEVQG